MYQQALSGRNLENCLLRFCVGWCNRIAFHTNPQFNQLSNESGKGGKTGKNDENFFVTSLAMLPEAIFIFPYKVNFSKKKKTFL